MKREELKCPVVDEYYGEGEYERFTDKYYYKDEADKVMDYLEAQVKNLNKANAELIKRVQELENENNELEAENEQLKDKK